MMVYCQANFLKGAGLGTRLFTWARCVIFSHTTTVPMLTPQWIQPRIGPLLRGGIDLGAYHRQILLLGLFQRRTQEIAGLKKLYIKTRAQEVEAPAKPDQPYQRIGSTTAAIVTFRGVGAMFEELDGWDQFLRTELEKITQKKWLDLSATFGSVPIGINVRMGNDFKQAQSPQDYYTKGAIKTPLPWFVDTLQAIRNSIGYPASAVVVSDGSYEDLQPLLTLENVRFVRPGCAISDLYILSNTKVLIASGASSFSAWAAFLGQMPAVSHPGQPLNWFKLRNRHGHYVDEFDPATPSSLFLEQANAILRTS